MERVAFGIATVVVVVVTVVAVAFPGTLDVLSGGEETQAAELLSAEEIDGDIVALTGAEGDKRVIDEDALDVESDALVDPSTTLYARPPMTSSTAASTASSTTIQADTSSTAPELEATKSEKTPAPTTTTVAKATTTTTAAKGTSSTVVIPSDAVYIASGQSIQAAVDKHPAGTRFVIGAGVHRRQTVVPKAKNVFIGEPGAVLDGEGVIAHAFSGNGGDDVVIRGLEIRNYATPLGKGTVKGGNASYGWLVEGNEIHNNEGIGVSASKDWKVRDNEIHHNEQYGVRALGSGVVFEGNEIAYNNADLAINPFHNGGGSKFINTVGLVLRNNYVHHNGGPGLWTDGDNIDTLFEGNRVEYNHHAGIKHEISCRATIRNNTVIGNGFGNPHWLAGAGIVVFNSPDVTVSGNTVRDNADGIAGIQSDRSSKLDGKNCRRELKNLNVTGNTVAMTEGYTGIVGSGGGVYTSWNNRFSSNTYQVDPNKDFFKWAGAKLTLKEWKQMGMG